MTWGRNATMMSRAHLNDQVRITGRLQSRTRKFGDEYTDVYEVSASDARIEKGAENPSVEENQESDTIVEQVSVEETVGIDIDTRAETVAETVSTKVEDNNVLADSAEEVVESNIEEEVLADEHDQSN